MGHHNPLLSICLKKSPTQESKIQFICKWCMQRQAKGPWNWIQYYKIITEKENPKP